MTKTNDIKALKLDIKQVARTASILNQNQIQKLWNSTREVYKYNRPAKGGGEWTYVKASYVRKVLDSVFGFNWDFDIETSLSEAFEIAKATKMCVVKGTVIGRVWHDGQWVEIKKTQFGRAEVKFKKNSTELLDFGNDMKAATSDCLKKCASLFGIAQDVYEASEFMEIEIIGSDENSDRAKQAEKRLKKAKKVIIEEARRVGTQNAKN
jgi:hypothetical protein